MLRNAEINSLMSAILLKLTPFSTKETNYQLWAIYDQLEEWKVSVEWEHPSIGTDHSVETAQSILAKLETLPDRKLAQEIEQIVKRHTHAHERKMKNVACGKVISDWQVKDTEFAGNHYAVATRSAR